MHTLPDYPLRQVAADLNDVAAFLALCDFAQGVLDARTVSDVLGVDAADALVLLGNSVLETAERAFAAMRAGLARRLVIAGGGGHSTAFLVESLRRDGRYAAVAAEGRREAELLGDIAVRHWGIPAERITLECKSTNCAENAAFAFRSLAGAASLILMQDPTMQRRTDASFRKVWRDAGVEARFANHPSFVPKVRARDGGLELVQQGAWPVGRFASLVMGEVPRLRDDAGGYGPNGSGSIVHVDIPQSVLAAHARLAAAYPELVRPAWAPPVAT